eukprot:Tamp_28778.p2 GENE.Tamp_28778~~Tamp_28778.p2  ORF type:complete len:138 (-),score=5.53 Tamp_28778:223-636(-)
MLGVRRHACKEDFSVVYALKSIYLSVCLSVHTHTHTHTVCWGYADMHARKISVLCMRSSLSSIYLSVCLSVHTHTHTHTHTHMCVHASCVCVRVVRVRVGCVHCASYCASDVLRAPAQPGTSAAAGVPPCADGRSSL